MLFPGKLANRPKLVRQARHYFLELKVCGSRPQNARKFKAKSPNENIGGEAKAALHVGRKRFAASIAFFCCSSVMPR
jgi:hypothetical protein